MTDVTGMSVPAARWRRTFLAHLETCRFDSSLYVGLVGVAGALLATPDPRPWQLVGAWLVPTLGWIASLYGGDYYDRELDAAAKPHRPIPSGRLRPSAVFAGMWVCIVAGAALALALNPLNLLLVPITGAIGVAYARVLKARGVSGNLMRGAATFMAFAVGTLAADPNPQWGLIWLGIVFWQHDSASNLVGAICDTDGDRAGGYLTYPVRKGHGAALRMLLILTALWVSSAVTQPFWLSVPFAVSAYAPYLAVSLGLTAVSLAILFRADRPIPRLAALRSHEVIVFERLILAGGFIAASGEQRLALIMVGATIAVTVVARALMRRKDHPALA